VKAESAILTLGSEIIASKYLKSQKKGANEMN
jgi:hypothetical protein